MKPEGNDNRRYTSTVGLFSAKFTKQMVAETLITTAAVADELIRRAQCLKF